MNSALISQKINQAVLAATNILLVGHQNPDADAWGSLAAFGEWLDSLGKNYDSFCRQALVNNALPFLINRQLKTQPEELAGKNYDLVVVFDSGDLKYAGIADVIPNFSPAPIVVNIDHHFTNVNFGVINLVNHLAVSTTEILFNFFQFLAVKISPTMATAMLAGLIYDTYSFTNPNTNYLTLKTAASLLSAGGNLNIIVDSLSKNKNVDILKTWGKIFFRLNLNQEFDIATTVLTLDDIKTQGQIGEVMEGAANFLNNLSGVKIILILQQLTPDIIKGSFRTNDDLIDVAKLAKILGGGGHKKAAGFQLNGRLEKTPDNGWRVA